MPTLLATEDFAKIFMRVGDLDGPPRHWVIGDSHALFFAGLEKMTVETVAFKPPPPAGYRVYYVGPGLATSLIKPVSRNRTREKCLMALDDIKQASGFCPVIFSFGEIDCRFHIRSRAQEMGHDTEDGWRPSAALSVQNYFHFLLEVKAQGFSPILWGPPPSTTNPALEHDWLTLGTPAERNALTRLVTGLMREEAVKHNLPFISLFEALMEGDAACPGWSSDAVHISQNHWPLWRAEATKVGLVP